MRGVGLLLVTVALGTLGCGAATELDTRDRADNTRDGGGLPAEGSTNAPPTKVPRTQSSTKPTPEPPSDATTAEPATDDLVTEEFIEDDLAGGAVVTDDEFVTDDLAGGAVVTDDDATELADSPTDVEEPVSSFDEPETDPEDQDPSADCKAFSIPAPTATEVANTTSYQTVLGAAYCRQEVDYDADGCSDMVSVRKVTGDLVNVETDSDADGDVDSTHEYAYDPGSNTWLISNLSLATGLASIIRNEFDAEGRLIRSDWDFDGDGSVNSSQVSAYDSDGHLTMAADLDEEGSTVSVTNYIYVAGKLDHSLLLLGAELQQSTTYVTDEQGRVTSQVRYSGSSTAPDLTIETAYDDVNNTQTDSHSDPSSGVTLIEVKTFDEAGHMIFDELQHADGVTYEKHEFIFDAAGNALQSLYTGASFLDERYSYDCADE